MADNEEVEGPVEARALSVMGATFAERKKANEAVQKKAVSARSSENKSVSSADSKSRKRV